jgi:hypothetical protein
MISMRGALETIPDRRPSSIVLFLPAHRAVHACTINAAHAFSPVLTPLTFRSSDSDGSF